MDTSRNKACPPGGPVQPHRRCYPPCRKIWFYSRGALAIGLGEQTEGVGARFESITSGTLNPEELTLMG